MTDTSHVRPTGLRLTTFSRRTCGQAHFGGSSCSSTTFSVGGSQYNRVCGRALAYRWGYNHGFYGYIYGKQGVEGQYVDGSSGHLLVVGALNVTVVILTIIIIVHVTTATPTPHLHLWAMTIFVRVLLERLVGKW